MEGLSPLEEQEDLLGKRYIPQSPLNTDTLSHFVEIGQHNSHTYTL